MIVSKTPYRISLFGGGSDFPEYFMNYDYGLVLSTSIDKYFYVIIKNRYDNKIRLSYSITETVDKVTDIKHEIVREALNTIELSHGLEISMMGDIPAGTGLGSSSAVTVGILNVLLTKRGISANATDLSRLAIDVENIRLYKPMGYQDQVAVAFGGLNSIIFTTKHPHFAICLPSQEIFMKTKQELNNNLFLFYTGITRSSSDILAKQVDEIKSKSSIVSEMVSICEQAITELLCKKFDDFGKLLNTTWELKKKLNPRTTNVDVDDLYNYGLSNGALGGKLLGAGFGGYMLFYVPKENQDKFKSAMVLKNVPELPFKFEERGSRIIFNDE